MFLEDDLCYRFRMVLWHLENGELLSRKREGGKDGGRE